MNRDFIGALLQLNAEKGVPREQLVHTVEDAIQSAYRRVAPGNEDVYVRLDIDTGRMRVFRARNVVDRGRGSHHRVVDRRGQGTQGRRRTR